MIDPSKKTIEQILNTTTNTFSVPKYQRTFNWGMDELKDLIQDLEDTQNAKNRDLFLGNFIFDVSTKDDFKIVDGQQRLTTISLILIAIREHARRLNESMLAGQIQSHISVNSVWSTVKGNKVTVSENIRDIFEHMAHHSWDGTFPEKIGTKQIKRQVQKVKPIYDYVMEIFSTYNVDELNGFIKTLFNSYVIVIEVQSQEDVFSIFERTNARGLDLNIGDLLKNMIFASSIEEYEDKWSGIINNAEGSLQRMLKYFWISREGYITASELYKSLKTYANKSEIGMNNFVDQLYSFSKYYKVVQSINVDETRSWLEEFELETLYSNEEYYKVINSVFQALKLFNVTQPYPLIYSIFKSYKNSGESSPKNLINCLVGIENYHFVNNVISGKIGNKVEKLYANAAKNFYDPKIDFINEVTKLLNDLKNQKAPKEDFVANYKTSVNYSSSNLGLLNYIFDRINNFGAKGGQKIEIYNPDKDIRKRNFNIEHFLPQSFKGTKFSESELELFDSIGNLLLISRHTNSTLGDKDPLEKVKILKADLKHTGSLRYLNDFLVRYEEDFEKWGFEQILKRTNDIAIYSYDEVWKF